MLNKKYARNVAFKTLIFSVSLKLINPLFFPFFFLQGRRHHYKPSEAMLDRFTSLGDKKGVLKSLHPIVFK